MQMDSNTVRYRGNSNSGKDIFEIVKKYDAYSKLPQEYQKTTPIGGTLSIVSRLLIVFLIYKEVSFYRNANLKFTFKPDVDLDKKLEFHLDVTVKMPCKSIGADIVDSTNQNIFAFGSLEEEDTWWELDAVQKGHFETIQHLNNFLREEYHSIADLIFKDILVSGKSSFHNDQIPDRQQKPKQPFDSCRIHGSLTLNKVAGNLHVTAGKSLHLPQGHIHLTSLFDDTSYNFSHRINRLSFGDRQSRIVQPLEGDERILKESSVSAQYFIDVVPTEINGILSKISTYQYSVKENVRSINHNKGSHGMPGLYFRYDMSALKVIVSQDRDNIVQFIVRLSSIISGIVVISGFFNTIFTNLSDYLLRTFAPEAVYLIKTHENHSKSKLPTVLANIKSSMDSSSSSYSGTTASTGAGSGAERGGSLSAVTKPNDLIINANKMTEISVSVTTIPHVY